MGIHNNPKPYLTKKHLADLQASGLAPEQMAVAGHFSADKVKAKKLTGLEVPGLIFQYFDLDGKPFLRTDGKPFCRIKPDWEDRKTEDTPKYLSPKREGCRPYFSRLYSDWKKATKSTKIDIWETEGEKKGDCACANGLAVIAFSGVDGWVDRCERKSGEKLENSRTLPELNEIEWAQRKVFQCFDSDIIEKVPVQQALAKRAHCLMELGAYPHLVLLPNETDGAKNGLDDFVVRHGVEALRVLAREAQPTSLKNQKSKKNDDTQAYVLDLPEPNDYMKAVMAWSVLKEDWAFRPGAGWYEWQKTHWELKQTEEFEAELNRFMDAQNWQKRSSNNLSSVIRLLRSKLLVQDKAWNSFGKLAFKNGTLDTNSRKFTTAYAPNDRLTRLRPYNFDPTAECPTWLRFINEAMGGDEESICLIQAIFRYAVLPRPKERKAEIEKSFDFFGQKGTGKGTTLDVLTNLVGIENVASINADTFKNATGLGQLIDRDLAIDHDASGFLSDVGLYNKVVSNEPVTVKKLYQDTYTARLGVVVVRAYNAFIKVPDGAEGLDRRLTVVPFNHRPKSVDIGLSRKLEAELAGIFAWCYSISADEMKRRILSAGAIRAIAEASIKRFEANSPEFRFLSEVFSKGKVGVKAGDLYHNYKEWCKRNGEQLKSNVKFADAIQALGCERSPKKNGCYFYTIPRMVDFDVADHLGIVQGDLSDSCQDSSNLDMAKDRDSCRQFAQKDSLHSNISATGGLEDEKTPVQGEVDLQSSTTVPNVASAKVPDICEVSRSVSAFQVGDRVEALLEGVWQFGTVLTVPNHHPDPSRRLSCWQVKLAAEERERYVWNREELRYPS